MLFCIEVLRRLKVLFKNIIDISTIQMFHLKSWKMACSLRRLKDRKGYSPGKRILKFIINILRR